MNSSVSQSVCLFVCLSFGLSHPFHYVSIIVSSWNFQGLIPYDRSDVHANGQDQRSKVKVQEVKIQFSRFRTITPVWIHIWWWKDAQTWSVTAVKSLKFASFFSCDQAALWFCPSVSTSVCPSQPIRCFCIRIIMKFSKVIIIDKSDVHAKSQGQRFKGKVKGAQKKFYPNLGFLDRNSSFEFTDGYKIMHKAWSSIEDMPHSRSSLKFQGHQRFWNDAQSLK